MLETAALYGVPAEHPQSGICYSVLQESPTGLIGRPITRAADKPVQLRNSNQISQRECKRRHRQCVSRPYEEMEITIRNFAFQNMTSEELVPAFIRHSQISVPSRHDEKDWQYDDNKSAKADANGTIDIEIGRTIRRKSRDYSRMLQGTQERETMIQVDIEAGCTIGL